MSHPSQRGSRSAGPAYLQRELAQTLIDDRLRNADSYRLRRQARTGSSSAHHRERSRSARRVPRGRPAVTTNVAPQSAQGRRSAEEVSSLVQSAALGDCEAWDQLVEEFSGLVWAIARAHRLSDADAADVAQSTWLRLLEHLGEIHEPARVGAWLATTARRECLRMLRVARRHVLPGDDMPDHASPDPAPDELVLLEERDQVLWRCFARLRPGDRALLRLLMADPRPAYEEISAALDMPIGSIGPTRARALERLQAELMREQELSLMTY